MPERGPDATDCGEDLVVVGRVDVEQRPVLTGERRAGEVLDRGRRTYRYRSAIADRPDDLQDLTLDRRHRSVPRRTQRRLDLDPALLR